jgi:hypothetical protein
MFALRMDSSFSLWLGSDPCAVCGLPSPTVVFLL